MSGRVLIDAICDLTLPPTSAASDEIKALIASPDLGDWYECADSIWTANAIAESLLMTYRNLKGPAGSSPKAFSVGRSDNRDWWRTFGDRWNRCEDLIDRYFALWAVTAFVMGMVFGNFI